MRNPPSWLLIFLAVPFNKIPLYSKNLIIFKTFFFSLFFRVISVPKALSEAFYKFFIDFLESVAVFMISLSVTFLGNLSVSPIFFLPDLENMLLYRVKSSINYPDCTILENWVFENFILADKPFAKALRIFEACVSVNNNLCGE